MKKSISLVVAILLAATMLFAIACNPEEDTKMTLKEVLENDFTNVTINLKEQTINCLNTH